MLTVSSILKPMSISGSIIQSIQKVSITINSGTSSSATISAVNTANTIIIYGGCIGSDTEVGQIQCGLTLTNSTTVTANVGILATSTTVVCTVVEFKSAAVNVAAQYGSVNIDTTSTSATATIASVNTSYAAIFPLGQTCTNTGTSISRANATNIELTNSTTVTATRGNTSGVTTLYFCVIEFSTSVIQSIQHRSLTSSSSSAAITDTISSVVVNNTMLTYNGMLSTTSGLVGDRIGLHYASLTNSTTVTLTRGAAFSYSRTYKYCVIEFKAGILNSAIQRGTITMTSVTNNTATISSVSTARGFVNWVGFDTTDSASDGWNDIAGNAVLTNATTVTAAMNTANASPTVVSYEVVEFA